MHYENPSASSTEHEENKEPVLHQDPSPVHAPGHHASSRARSHHPFQSHFEQKKKYPLQFYQSGGKPFPPSPPPLQFLWTTKGPIWKKGFPGSGQSSNAPDQGGGAVGHGW